MNVDDDALFKRYLRRRFINMRDGVCVTVSSSSSARGCRWMYDDDDDDDAVDEMDDDDGESRIELG